MKVNLREKVNNLFVSFGMTGVVRGGRERVNTMNSILGSLQRRRQRVVVATIVARQMLVVLVVRTAGCTNSMGGRGRWGCGI